MSKKLPREQVNYSNPCILNSPRKGINFIWDTVKKEFVTCNHWDCDLADEIVERFRTRGKKKKFIITAGQIILCDES